MIMFKKTVTVNEPKSVLIENQLKSTVSMFEAVIKNLDSVMNEAKTAYIENGIKIKELNDENEALLTLSNKANNIVKNIGSLIS